SSRRVWIGPIPITPATTGATDSETLHGDSAARIRAASADTEAESRPTSDMATARATRSITPTAAPRPFARTAASGREAASRRRGCDERWRPLPAEAPAPGPGRPKGHPAPVARPLDATRGDRAARERGPRSAPSAQARRRGPPG